MRFRFVWIGKTKDPLLFELEERYLARIGRHYPAERTAVPELKKTDPRQHRAQMSREARALELKIPDGSRLVVLDEAGREYSSRELSDWIQRLGETPGAEAVFLVGGHLGVPERIRRRADERVALSKLTLPHELARVVLLEQIYRAVTLIKGFPYHK